MQATPYQAYKHQQAPSKQTLSRPIPIRLYT